MQYHKVERGIIPMKNSDMKVIAIILSIALFFTIVTSNAVSIASVVFLAKGQTATEGTVGENTDNTVTPDANNNASTNNNASNNSTVTPETTAPAADSNANTNTDANANANTNTDANANNNADANKPAGDANKPATDANKPADNAGATSGIDKEALAMFQKAAKDINTKGVAGYSYKSWQAIESINVGGNDKLKGLIESFLTKEEDAETKVQEKGSEDAMRRMPISNCSESTIASVTKKASGSNVVVTIVMKDVTNPAKTDTDGLNVMSRDFLYMEDVHNTVKTDSAVKLLVKSLDKGEITYDDYTITATMTKDGKFVEITHRCAAKLIADAKLIVGSIQGDGVLVFNVRYWDFKY